jgi:hypothetical protein
VHRTNEIKIYGGQAVEARAERVKHFRKASLTDRIVKLTGSFPDSGGQLDPDVKCRFLKGKNRGVLPCLTDWFSRFHLS